jgi:hypothetical protein
MAPTGADAKDRDMVLDLYYKGFTLGIRKSKIPTVD